MPPDTATAGSDYNLVSSTFVIPINSSNGTVECTDIIITADDGFERDETFTLELTATSPDVVLGTSVVNITIIDADG